MYVREVGRDTTSREEQFANAAYLKTTRFYFLLIVIAEKFLITRSMKVTLDGTTILFRPDVAKAFVLIDKTDLVSTY